MKNLLIRITSNSLFYFVCGLVLTISLIGNGVSGDDLLYKVPSLYVIAGYLVGYFTRRTFDKDNKSNPS
jgi:hypothetical protein